MRVLSTKHGARGDVEPLRRLAVQLEALGAEVRAGAPSAADLPRRAAEDGDAVVATGGMPTGGWR